MTDYTEKAADLLPCSNVFCYESEVANPRGLHNPGCPAERRPAVAAALRDVAIEAVGERENFLRETIEHSDDPPMLLEDHIRHALARARQEERERFRAWCESKGASYLATIGDLDRYLHEEHGECQGCRYGYPVEGGHHVVPRGSRGNVHSRCLADTIRAGEDGV